MSFSLASNYQPKGDQAQAIAKLSKSILAGNRHQTLLGVTGSGPLFCKQMSFCLVKPLLIC